MNLKGLDYSQLIGGVGQLIGGIAPQQWTSYGERNVDTLTSGISMAGTGAQIGTSIAPGIGTAIGAGVGLIGGLASKAFKNGRVEGQNFMDASQIKEIKPGWFGKSRHGQYLNAVNNANNNLASVYNSMKAQQTYLEENDTDTNILGRANGGMVPPHPIKLSKGEVYVDKDGNATRIGNARPNTKDDVLAYTTEGYVFSHAPKFKNKKTNETPADEAARMMNTKKITGNDRYAEGTRNAQKLVFKTLKNKQELLKANEDPSIQKFSKGGADLNKKEKIRLNRGIDSDYDKIPQHTYKDWYDVALKKTYNSYVNRVKNERSQELQNIYSNIATDAISLAPIVSSLFLDKPDTVQPVNNPYESLVASTMRNRRYNARPELDAIDLNRRITNYNMRNINTNTGAGIAYALQSAVNADRAMSSVRAQENNANNAYAAEYANSMNSLGQQRVAATNMANEINAQNLAAYNDIRRNALNEISSWAQNKQLMRNQRSRDNAMLALYDPFLKYGFTNSTISDFKKWQRRGGNYVG